MQVVVLFFLLISPSLAAFTEFYYLPAVFPDNTALTRKLIIDITTPFTYVYNSKAFPALGVNSFVDFSASTSYKTVDGALQYNLRPEYNDVTTLVKGPFGQDKWNLVFTDFTHTFGVVTEGDVGILKGPDGVVAAGRIGFLVGNDTSPINLRDTILQKFATKVLCLGTAVSTDGSNRATHVGIGRKIFPDTDHVITMPIKGMYPDGLWRIYPSTVRVGSWTTALNFPVVFTSTSDKLGVPYWYATSMFRQLKASYDKATKRYVADCENVNIEFQFKDKWITIERRAFSDQIGSGKCALRLYTYPEKEFRLGLPFFVNNGVCMNYGDNTLGIYKVNVTTSIVQGLDDEDGVEFTSYS